MLRLTLAARITLLVVVSLLAVWIAALAGFYRNRADDFESGIPDPARVAAIVSLAETFPKAQRLEAFKVMATRRLQLEIVPDSGALAPLTGWQVPTDVRAGYEQVLGDRKLDVMAVNNPFVSRWFPGFFINASNGLEMRIGLKTSETLLIETRGPLVLNRLGLPIGFGAGMTGTMIALFALWVMHRETKPLARLAAAVDRIDLSGEPVPLPLSPRSAPEIKALIAAFDRLQTRLHTMVRARLALVGGISHDVRTFATRLRLRTEKLPDEAERARAVADIEDMIKLLDDALIASRTGAGELEEEMVEIAPLVWEDIRERRAAGARADFREAQGAGGAVVLGDRLALKRVVANVVDNALKYGRAAHASVQMDGDWVLLRVDDEGSGIPEGKRELMLEPFSRIETSRSRGTGGAGLGLAVVATLVAAHAGRIAIASTPAGGARVEIRLPVFRPVFEDRAASSK